MELDNKTIEESTQISKSFVKLYKNSRGYNWEIRVVEGDTEKIKELKDKAVEINNELQKDLGLELDI